MKLESATAIDADPIIELIFDLSQWLKTKNVSQWTSRYPRETLEGEIHRGEVFVWRPEAILIATVTLNEEKDAFWKKRNAEAMYLHRLAIARSHAGLGLGAKIMTWAENNIRSRGKKLLRLDCDVQNEILKKFYSNLGYEMVGVHHHDAYNMDFALFEKSLET
jgi:GNAT superfamily N-acetyltransferase